MKELTNKKSPIHLLEDLSKPENRTNWALLAILQLSEIKALICQKFNLPSSILISPAQNLKIENLVTTQRPDFKITTTLHGDPSSYIEVELGSENKEQIRRYKKDAKVPIYSIVGKDKDVSDCECTAISLEELSEEARKIQVKYLERQESVSLELFCGLVEHYITRGSFDPTNKRTSISDKMRESTVIRFFLDYLGEENFIDSGKCKAGKFLLDTVTENGFSLRVYSRESSSNSLSIMARSGGRAEIIFPSFIKLKKYLPYKLEPLGSYVELLEKLGASEIRHIKEKERTSLSLNIVESNLKSLADCINRLR